MVARTPQKRIIPLGVTEIFERLCNRNQHDDGEHSSSCVAAPLESSHHVATVYMCILVTVLSAGRTAAFLSLQRLQMTPISAHSPTSSRSRWWIGHLVGQSSCTRLQRLSSFRTAGDYQDSGQCFFDCTTRRWALRNDQRSLCNGHGKRRGAHSQPRLAHGATIYYPIYFCVPPTQLRDFLVSLPDIFRERRDDFIFLSGGLATMATWNFKDLWIMQRHHDADARIVKM